MDRSPPSLPLHSLVRLRPLIVLAFFEPLRDQADLRSALADFAAQCRMKGYLCEQVLVPIKALLEDDALGTVPLETHRVMHDRIVRWVIEAYYNEPLSELGSDRPKKAGP